MENFDWTEIWAIIGSIVLPHLGKLILTVVICLILGILIAITILIIYGRKKVLSRKNKIYRIIIRIIYIPAIILVCIVFSFQIGLAYSIYRIIKSESTMIADGIYKGTIDQAFSSERGKEIFLNQVKEMAQRAQTSNGEFSYSLKQGITQNTNNATINKFTSYLVKKYNEELFSTLLYGMCYATGIKFDEKLNYSDFENITEALMKTDHDKIEKSIKFALADKIKKIAYKQCKSFVGSVLLIWIIILVIPLIEFFIYKQWIEKKSDMSIPEKKT